MDQKNKAQLHIFYMKPTLNIEIYREIKSKEMDKIYHANTNHRKLRVAILISERLQSKENY